MRDLEIDDPFTERFLETMETMLMRWGRINEFFGVGISRKKGK